MLPCSARKITYQNPANPGRVATSRRPAARWLPPILRGHQKCETSGRLTAPLFAGLPADEFADDVKVAEVAGVLLEQVKQDPLECRGVGPVPAVAGFADVSKVMGLDDGPAAASLRV